MKLIKIIKSFYIWNIYFPITLWWLAQKAHYKKEVTEIYNGSYKRFWATTSLIVVIQLIFILGMVLCIILLK